LVVVGIKVQTLRSTEDWCADNFWSSQQAGAWHTKATHVMRLTRKRPRAKPTNREAVFANIVTTAIDNTTPPSLHPRRPPISSTINIVFPTTR
jgi:hypothetical protein